MTALGKPITAYFDKAFFLQKIEVSEKVPASGKSERIFIQREKKVLFALSTTFKLDSVQNIIYVLGFSLAESYSVLRFFFDGKPLLHTL